MWRRQRQGLACPRAIVSREFVLVSPTVNMSVTLKVSLKVTVVDSAAAVSASGHAKTLAGHGVYF